MSMPTLPQTKMRLAISNELVARVPTEDVDFGAAQTAP